MPTKGRKTPLGTLTKNWAFTGWPHKGAKMPAYYNQHHAGAIAYICGKMEEGGNSTQPHIQGWVQFIQRKRFTAVQKIFPPGQFRIAPCRGTEEENQKYCKKTDTQIGEFESHGHFQVQGRSNVSAIAGIEEAVKEGRSKKFLWDNYFSVMSTRYRGVYEGITQLRDTRQQQPLFTQDQFGWAPVEWGVQKEGSTCSLTWVFAGEAGIGKTQLALLQFGEKPPLICTRLDDLKRYDDSIYGGLLLDDFDDVLYGLKRTEQVHLAEQEGGRSIQGRFEDAYIPAGTKKIFTTNDLEGTIFNPHPSLTRRHKIRILKREIHPVGSAVVPNVPASSSSREPGNLSPDGLDDEEEPGRLVRANAAYSFEIPEQLPESAFVPSGDED